MKWNLFKEKNYIARWLFSYLVIILCLFTAMAVIVDVYSSSLKKEMNEFNEFVFESVAASVNDVLLDVNDLHLSLVQNENLDKVISLKGNRLQSQDTYALIDDLNSYRRFATNVDRFFVYLKDEDLIISENGITDSRSYYNYYFNTGYITYEEWKQIFYDFANDRYISFYAKNDLNETIDSLGFMFRVPLQTPKAVGVILCDKQYFMKNIEKIEWKNLCDIYIYNGEGNLMLVDKNSEDGEIPRTLKEVEEYEKKDNIVFKKVIAVDKYYWQLFTVVSKDALNTSIYFSQAFTVVTVFISLILLIFLVKYLLKMNRKPLQSVLSLFGTTDEKDEYEALYRLINETLTNNSNLLKNLEVRDRELKIVAISKIIKGDLPSSALVEYNIEFRNENYAVISFCLENLSTLFKEDTVMPSFERNYHLRYIINNVMEELLIEEGIRLYTTEIDQNVVCLANLEDNISERDLSILVEKGVSYLNNYFDINLKFAVSDIYRAFTEISVAYAQTVEILEYKRIMKTNENISFAQLHDTKEGSYVFDLRSEERLVHYIKIGSTQEAIAQVALIFDELRKVGTYSSDYIRYVALDIASTVTKCAGKFLENDIGNIPEMNIYKSIQEGTDLVRMQEEINRHIGAVCGALGTVSKKKKRQKCSADEIIEYVRDNLTDCNLNAVSIGVYFNLTAAYVSRLFKDSMEISLTDYIAIKRVERAQELISEGKHSIREISEMVGFNHERTFYRAQKKFGKM